MNQPRGRPFQKGNSFGRGRPKGSRNKLTEAAQQMLGNYSSALTSKCIQEALKGDTACLRLCLERILPIQRDRTVQVKIPKITDARTAAQAGDSIIAAVAKGKLTSIEGESMVKMVEACVKLSEVVECVERIEALENRVGKSQPAGPNVICRAT